MRTILFAVASAGLLLAQTKLYTVKEDAALRAGCAEDAAEVAQLKKGDAVKIRFALAGSAGPCYKVSVETDGKSLDGYLHADALTGLDQFDQERRKASAASLPLMIRGTKTTAPPTPRRVASASPAGAKTVPDFSFTSLENPASSHSNASMSGRTYLIDFWATWCGPCRSEMPHLHRIYEKYRARNFEILSISLDEKPADVIRFREGQWKMPWLHAYSAGGFTSEAARRFGIKGIPSAVLVGPDGVIIARGGSLRGQGLDQTLARALR